MRKGEKPVSDRVHFTGKNWSSQRRVSGLNGKAKVGGGVRHEEKRDRARPNLFSEEA